jgi:uncharacterized protein (DUF305 family)
LKTRLAPTAAAVTLAAGLLIGACSSSTDHGSMNGNMNGATTSTAPGSTGPSIPADAEFNATDVGFAQGMIPHHAQAIVMADMALAQATNPEVKQLATQIKAAQAPEIEQLTMWLQAWGQPTPDNTGGTDHSMSGMDGMMMSGMMSDADMARLENTTGTDFDAMWLEMMTQHHQGAISMARDEVTGGKYAATKAMAESIVTSQQAEIDTMTKLMTQPQ